MEAGQSLGAQPDPSAAVRIEHFDAYLQSLASKELTSEFSGGSDTSSGLRMPPPPAKPKSRVKDAKSEYSTEAGASTGSDPARTSLAETVKSDKGRVRMRQQELDRFEAGHPSEQAFQYSMIPTELHNYLVKNVREAATLLQEHQGEFHRRFNSSSSTQKDPQEKSARRAVAGRGQAVEK